MRRVPGQTESALSTLYLAFRKAPGDAAAQSETAHRLVGELLTAAGHGDAAWHKDENGRPTVGKSGLDVSITHTTGLVFCALLVAEEARLGIDAEVLRPHPHASRLATRYFGPCEKALVAADPAPRAFLTCFTKKEAFAKYRGDGLAHHLSGDDTAAPDFEAQNGVRFFCMEREGALLTLCLPAGCEPTLIEI